MKAEIYNYSTWINNTDKLYVNTLIECILLQCNFSILGYIDHQFTPQGYTAIWLLAESHCAVHTFPEHGKTYVELSSCNEYKHIEFINAMQLQK